MLLRRRLDHVEHLPHLERRQQPLLVLELGVGIVGALHVGAQEAREADHLAGGGEEQALAA